jgi:dTDP-4-dehydrorhamnose 3,5-epimerase
MTFTALALPEVVLIEPQVFADERGFFLETYHRRRFAEHGLDLEFVQDNHSRSRRGVVRGLHFQREPFAQGKLVRVAAGAVFDVAVDIRPGSPGFGRWVGEVLSAGNHRMLYVPAGFAHGFCALEDGTEVLYKTTAFYSQAHEGGVLWNDPKLGIAWPDPGVEFMVSAKDRALPGLDALRPR